METTQQLHVNLIDTSCDISLAAQLEPFTQYLPPPLGKEIDGAPTWWGSF